jgi:energy-coupling factor transporter ATP-binding protein EcfA2
VTAAEHTAPAGERLDVAGVTRRYGTRVALDQVTLSVRGGEIVGLLGANGAGKSTLLRIMAGMDKNFEGVAKLTSGFTVGILEQEPHLNPDKDVFGNVEEAVASTRALLTEYEQLSEKLGEVIAPVTDALGDTGPVPGGGKAWEFQLGMHLKGVSGKGELADMELVYRSSSVGGKRAIGGLALLVSQKLSEGDANMVPVVTLSSESYKHKQYGKIYTPVIDIVKWVPMPKAQAAAPKAEAKPEKKKARK